MAQAAVTLILDPHDRRLPLRRLIGLDVAPPDDGVTVRLRRADDERFGVIVAAHTDGLVDVAYWMTGDRGVTFMRSTGA